MKILTPQEFETKYKVSADTVPGATPEKKQGFFSSLFPKADPNGSFDQRIAADFKERGKNVQASLDRADKKGIGTGTPPLESTGAQLQEGFNIAGQFAGGAVDIITQAVRTVGNGLKAVNDKAKVVPGVTWTEDALAAGGKYLLDKATDQPNILSGLNKINAGIDKYNEWAAANPEDAKTIEGAINIASLLVGEGAKKPTGDITGKFGPVTKTISSVEETVAKPFKSTIKTIEDFTERISAPEVSEATKVSLNPKEALKGTGQDFTVSVGGKLVKLSDITDAQNLQIKTSTEKSLNKFTDQARKFAKDRSVKGGSPVEIVGQRVDAALEFANKKRQQIGQKMGDIEVKYVDQPLPVGDKTLETFAKTLKDIENPKFGVDTANAPIVKKLVEDFDLLTESGATIGERLDFVRSWDKYLRDAKDPFGNFKENASVNTQIQNAVATLKNETVDAISAKDKVYRKLRSDYRVYKQLDEIGDRLLGKEGALGDRVKGAATVKRAIQSNSDAGARQFLAKLKELTGYDAIKEGDIALTAMESVGDYQGLSLLNIVREGKSGLINRGLEFLRDKAVGTNEERIRNYIQK